MPERPSACRPGRVRALRILQVLVCARDRQRARVPSAPGGAAAARRRPAPPAGPGHGEGGRASDGPPPRRPPVDHPPPRRTGQRRGWRLALPGAGAHGATPAAAPCAAAGGGRRGGAGRLQRRAAGGHPRRRRVARSGRSRGRTQRTRVRAPRAVAAARAPNDEPARRWSPSLQETASTDSHSVWASVPNKPSTDAKCVRNPFGCMDLRRELGEETGGAADASGIYHRDEGRSGERLSETECRP